MKLTGEEKNLAVFTTKYILEDRFLITDVYQDIQDTSTYNPYFYENSEEQRWDVKSAKTNDGGEINGFIHRKLR